MKDPRPVAAPLLSLLGLFVPLAFVSARPVAGAPSAPCSAGSPLKDVRLVVLKAGDPGPLTIGFHVEMQPGWHLYWANPGDAGLAPKARWTLPPGFVAGPLRHPVPGKSVRDGLISYEHEGRVLLLCDITPPAAGWPKGPCQVSAVLEWMACRESCLTGETPVRTALPPDAASLAAGRALFESSAPSFPRPFSASGLTAGPAQAAWNGRAWLVEIVLAGGRASEAADFFACPVEGFVIENAGVACRGGRIIIPLVPSRGAGAPPPSAVAGLLFVGGAGYELQVPVTSRPSSTERRGPRVPSAGPSG
jgi:thiol:disulfide interchange protein DsbD